MTGHRSHRPPQPAPKPQRPPSPPGPQRPARCANCRRLILPGEVLERSGQPVCPHCGLPLPKAHLA